MKTVAQVGDATLTDDTENVRLRCSGHNGAEWCPEMELMMKNSLDYPSVDAIAEPTQVTVPLMPSRDYWANTEVRPIHVGGMHEFYVSTYRQPGALEENEPQYVGMIAPGEGRNAMRLILFEWLKFRFITVPPCSSRVHPRGDIFGPRGTGRFPMPPRATDPTPIQLCITYDLLTAGICAGCALLADTSHDVPEGV